MLLSIPDIILPRQYTRSTSLTFRARRGKDVWLCLLYYTL